MSRMPPTVVSDATCIIALHRIGRLEILKELYRIILIPPAVAIDMPGALLIKDDRKARKVAFGFGLRINGTIGVLIHAWRSGIILEPEKEIERLSETGFHMTPELRQEALRLMRQE